jgi:hypothetical protein
MKRRTKDLRINRRLATDIWGKLPRVLLASLRHLTNAYGFSLVKGDLTYLNGCWYVTHAGLLRLAKRRRCTGIQVEAVRDFCDSQVGRWIFKATVSLPNCSGPFVGFGDADPSNVSPLARGAEMRVAETRAVNRALRKAYGIGFCSFEETGCSPAPCESVPEPSKRPPHATSGNEHANGRSGSRVRDRLCQLIRQHQLEPDLVKAYAVDFCGTSSLKEASRFKVEQFVQHLADLAERDRDALLCQLNSYPRVERCTEQKDQPKEGAA